MEAVLGLSMTPTTVGLVLVEGQDADGATVGHDAFDVSERDASSACEQAAAAVRRTEAIAATRGHRLHTIGVTWRDDADAEISLLLKSLTDSGFDNVVPVRLPEATEALARGIADVIGYPTTAVCVVEPECVITLVVHTGDGSVQTAVNHAIQTEADLIRWLGQVFSGADWRPDALVVVGSAGDLDDLLPPLEQALSVPVFTPAEAELALARGAALAAAGPGSAGSAEFSGFFSGFAFDQAMLAQHSRDTRAARRRRLSQLGPAAMLGAGAVTFVVSLSLAIGLQMAPDQAGVPEPQTVAVTVHTPAAVRQVPPPAAVPQVAEPPLAPPPEAPPADAPAPEALPVDAAEVPEAPVVTEEVPAALPDVPPDAAAPEPMPPSPVDAVPVVPEVPEAKPPLLTRILSRIPGLQPGELPPEAPAPAEVIPPPAP